MKEIVVIPLGIIAVVGVVWGLSYFSLAHKETFQPKFQDVERKTFERTKSYVHGKRVDLAKYYEEYQTTDDRSAIEALVKMNFADFDENDIKSDKLRKWLVSIRGY